MAAQLKATGTLRDRSPSFWSSPCAMLWYYSLLNMAIILAMCCSVQHVAGSGAVPLLLTAQPGGVQLAARVLELAAGGCAAKTGATAAWAGLALLPHACQKPSQALAASDAVLAGGLGAQQLGASKAPADGGAADVDGSLFVYCQVGFLR